MQAGDAVQRLPKGPVKLRDGGDGSEAVRRARGGGVVAGGRGLRGRNGAMEAPPERRAIRECSAGLGAGQLRDGEGGEGVRRIRGARWAGETGVKSSSYAIGCRSATSDARCEPVIQI